MRHYGRCPERRAARRTALYLLLDLGLLQPVHHPHLAVHRRRGGEMLPRPVALGRVAVELTEAAVAVGSEGTHGEIGGDRQRLAICRLGLVDITQRRVHVSENPEGIALAAARVG